MPTERQHDEEGMHTYAPASQGASRPWQAATQAASASMPHPFGEPDNLTFKEWVQLHELLSRCGRRERARVHRRVVSDMRTEGDGLTDNRTAVQVRVPLSHKAALNALATSRDTTRSDVLRDAVREYLKDHRDEVRQAIEAGRDAE